MEQQKPDISGFQIWVLDELLDDDQYRLPHLIQRLRAMNMSAWEGLALLPELYCKGFIKFFELEQLHGNERVNWEPEPVEAEILERLRRRTGDYKFCVRLSEAGFETIQQINDQKP